ncbi:MAG: NACHT domain-containing protein, partial [Dehalococcoidia bacterium]|nr:NACHT domain-containing protein [Dehalococcoidia bacterium]
MNIEEKLKVLQDFSEKELVNKVVLPLFKCMGFMDIRKTHGSGEKGLDLVFYKEDDFGEREYSGVQVKAVKIHGAAGKRGNAIELLNQASQAFSYSFIDIYGNKPENIDKFVILTSCDIDIDAIRSIEDELRNQGKLKKIQFIDGHKLADLIDKHLKSFFWDEYDYFTKYFEAMKSDFETIKDVSAIGQREPVPLEDIYVSLRVAEKDREIGIRTVKGVSFRPSDFVDDEEAASREWPVNVQHKIFEGNLVRGKPERGVERQRVIDAERAIKDYNRLVIVGVPGSGKTTLLKHLALYSCRDNLEKQERTCVPIPVTLREFADSNKSLRAYIDGVFEKYHFPKAKEFVEKDLKEGKCQLLLDGFDELATESRHTTVAQEIHKFIEAYPKAQIVVTSRIAGYHDELKGFTKLELMEFDNKQIGRFIGNWFGKTDTEKAKSMLDAINKNEP